MPVFAAFLSFSRNLCVYLDVICVNLQQMFFQILLWHPGLFHHSIISFSFWGQNYHKKHQYLCHVITILLFEWQRSPLTGGLISCPPFPETLSHWKSPLEIKFFSLPMMNIMSALLIFILFSLLLFHSILCFLSLFLGWSGPSHSE